MQHRGTAPSTSSGLVPRFPHRQPTERPERKFTDEDEFELEPMETLMSRRPKGNAGLEAGSDSDVSPPLPKRRRRTEASSAEGRADDYGSRDLSDSPSGNDGTNSEDGTALTAAADRKHQTKKQKDVRDRKKKSIKRFHECTAGAPETASLFNQLYKNHVKDAAETNFLQASRISIVVAGSKFPLAGSENKNSKSGDKQKSKKQQHPSVKMTLILSSSAIRCCEILKEEIEHPAQSDRAAAPLKTAKLFSKHMDKTEQANFLRDHAGRISYGVGTPQRVLELIRDGSLSVESVQGVVFDVCPDAKGFSVLNMHGGTSQAAFDLWHLYLSHLDQVAFLMPAPSDKEKAPSTAKGASHRLSAPPAAMQRRKEERPTPTEK